MYKTKNDLPEKVRAEMVTLLQQRLAHCIDLRDTGQAGPLERQGTELHRAA